MAGKPSDADLLPLPTIPKPKKDDPEDVAWALSTAEAMWNRAENADAIKWIRRAAEAASEAEADNRALELAKAAADLAGMLVRVEAPPEPRTDGPSPVSADPPPNTLQSQAPPPGPPPVPPPPPPAPLVSTMTPSRPPPAPVVSSSSPPRAPSVAPAPRVAASQPVRPLSAAPAPASAAPPASVPAKAPAPARAAPPQASLPKVTHSRAGERRRRSGHNLSEEAKRAAHAEIISRAGGESEVTKPHGMPMPPKPEGRRRRSRPSPDEVAPPEVTVIAPRAKEAVPPPSAEEDKHDTDPPAAPEPMPPRHVSHTEEMDQWPTQSLQNDELGGFDDQRTRIGASPYVESARRPIDAPSGLRASQAVRVIVWRGPDGVHVAPAGTTVSAITVDALLVALDPNADLAAWLKG